MYIYFEDWSQFLGMVDPALSPGNHIIKVYTSTIDPRTTFRDTIKVVEINDAPFDEKELFSYEARGVYSGPQLEEHLNSMSLTEDTKRRMRALFRFGNLPETGFNQAAMAIRNEDGTWLMDHPFGDIDGIELARQNPEMRGDKVHLDIFFPESLDRLFRLIGQETVEGIMTNPEQVVTMSEVRQRQTRIVEERMMRRGTE